MTPLQQLQKMLDGRQYQDETTEEIEKFAKDNNLVIVFGESDDLVEFRGTINDEVYSHQDIYVGYGEKTLFRSTCEIVSGCPYFQEILNNRLNNLQDLFEIKVHQKNAWSYSTDIVHLKFKIFEDDNLYCEGIVFDLDNLTI